MENIGRLNVAKLNAFLFKDQNCNDFGLKTLYIFTLPNWSPRIRRYKLDESCIGPLLPEYSKMSKMGLTGGAPSSLTELKTRSSCTYMI